MSVDKREIDRRLTKVEQEYQRVLEQKRLEWLQQICREAMDTYNFSSLGELIAFMFDHAGDIQNEQAK